MVNKEIIGNNIREARVNAGLTQEDIADLLYVAPRNYRNWELIGTTDIDKIALVAEICKVPFTSLLKGAIA